MSAEQSDRVDLDLLADYVGGALDGTAAEQAVARLIAEDAQWAQAYARLAHDSADVRLALAEWGAVPAPMPPDIVERLSAGLAAAAAGRDRTAEQRDDRAGSASRSGAARPPGRPDADSARPAGRKARRRLPGWATPVAVVAALVAIAGLGVSQLAGDVRETDNGAAAFSGDVAQPQGAEAGSAAQPGPLTEPSPGQVFATGTDYTRDSLVNRVGQFAALASATTRPGPSLAAVLPDRASGESAPNDLSARRSTLSACLRAIAGEHGRGTPRFEVVDYARFEGKPALVVVFADADGQRWAWVVAPECGQRQAGAAARYTARVG
ncbi:MAG TPA: hypothetical protein VHN18_12650 [Micromonosporaceae bacterium]|nr:hypothetical protein [Micromonosporaceae bacterium]